MDLNIDKKRAEYFDNDSLAVDVWVGKYRDENEVTPDDMHMRMAKEFGRIEYNYREFEKTLNSAKLNSLCSYGKNRVGLDTEVIYDLFKNFGYIVPQGSIMSQLGNNKQIGSLSNCFVIGQPDDSYGGIMLKDQELVQLMKRRGGVGIDISTLRPSGTPTSNAAKSSTGATSFMERFSNSTREVAQNGRRGALMLSIDVRHPDVADFVKIKNDRTKVTGANISVSLRDDFMEAVKADKDYFLQYPVNFDLETLSNQNKDEFTNDLIKYPYGKTVNIGDDLMVKRVKAKELYDLIIENAWDNAEPGQIFIDRHWDYSPDGIYPMYKGITTNPCGEIFMQAYDACRLMAINFYSFVDNKFTDKASVNYDKLYSVAYEQQRLADDLVDLELEKIDRIIDKINNDKEADSIKAVELELWKKIKAVASSGRRTGCGFTGLGDMIAALGLDYDSEAGMETIRKVMETKMTGELDCTIDLAILRGSFDGYSHEIEYDNGIGRNSFYKFIKESFPVQYERMISVGRRNVSWSTVAPTGSVSILTQTTSGLEPVFSVYPYLRRKKLNPDSENVRVDFIDENGDKWQEFPVTHKGLIDCIRVRQDSPEIISLYDLSEKTKEEDEKLVGLIVEYLDTHTTPYSKSSANDINWINRVKIQSIIQKYTTHSISSTINLPSDVTKEEVSEIYITSWDLKLKGVTIYRDGCRTGVLVTKKADATKEIIYNDSPKRPNTVKCDIFHPKVKGKTYTVIVGLLGDKPFEVFALDIEVAKGHSNGLTKRIKSGLYSLTTTNNNDSDEVYTDIGKTMSDTETMLCKSISANLRHGMHVKFIVEILSKGEGDITSFTKVIGRTLKKYIPDGTESNKTCGDCGSKNSMIYEEGCSRCKICGSSKCG